MLIFCIVLYFLATLAIGFYASRKVKTTGDFINAGRSLHPAVNTAALFALWFGSETIFGASAQFADRGLIAIIEDPLGGVLCLLLVGFFSLEGSIDSIFIPLEIFFENITDQK